MSNWKPPHLRVGDIVLYSEKPKWGTGVVLDVLPLGVIPFKDGTSIRYHRDDGGQVVSVRFADGRTRKIMTPVKPLKVVEPKMRE